MVLGGPCAPVDEAPGLAPVVVVPVPAHEVLHGIRRVQRWARFPAELGLRAVPGPLGKAPRQRPRAHKATQGRQVRWSHMRSSATSTRATHHCFRPEMNFAVVLLDTLAVAHLCGAADVTSVKVGAA